MAKAIVTAAITGAIHTPTMSPYLPIKPEEIAEHAIGAYEAGAAIVHIHVRNPENRPAQLRYEHFPRGVNQNKKQMQRNHKYNHWWRSGNDYSGEGKSGSHL